MKRIQTMKYATMFFLLLILSQAGIYAQSNTAWTPATAAAWYKKGDWLNGMKLHPHASTDKLEFAKQYSANKKLWDEAFAFLKNNNLDSLKPFKHRLYT